jgi:hypothetical protein
MSYVGGNSNNIIQPSLSGAFKRGTSSSVPTSIAGLINWTRAGSGAKQTGGAACTDGTTCETITRMGGTVDLAQLTGTNQPTYNTGIINGLPVLTFDGVDNYMTATVSVTGTTASWFAALRYPTVTAGDRIAVLWDGVANDWNSASTGIFVFENAALDWRASRNNADRSLLSLPLAAPANIIIGSVYDGTNSIIYADNIAQAAVACVGSFNANNFTLGAGYSGGIGFWANIQVAEMMLYSSAVSPTDASRLFTFLNDRYLID